MSETNAERLQQFKSEKEFLWKVSPDLQWLIEQAEKAERYEKALKEITESDEDISCNEIAIKYEVIAEKALNS